jgi:hypothetical protein
MSWSMRRGVGLIAMLMVGAHTFGGCTKQQPPTTAEEKFPADEQLCQRLDRTIDSARTNRHLSTSDQAAWQVVHGILAYGRDFQVYHDGKLVGALDYLLGGGELRGWTIRKGDHGVLAVQDPGSKTGQGHPDQWLGYMSQCGLSVNDTITAEGQKFKIADLITQAQWDIFQNMEATWTLMGFVTYLPLDAQWKAKDGTTWTIPRMVEMETGQDLKESACGGTHRIYALTLAVNRYRDEGGKFGDDAGGIWERAQEKIDDAVDTIKRFQQPSGCFSTNYFVRPSNSSDIAVRLGTTGHALEFLTVALDDDELREPWVTRALLHLLDCFDKTEKFDVECGALYHAAHALELYRARRFGPRNPSSSPSEPAKSGVTTAAANGPVK